MPALFVPLLLAFAAPPADDATAPPAADRSAAELSEAFRQPGDDVAAPLVPVEPRAADVDADLDAQALFLSARVKNRGGDPEGAYDDLRAAHAVDRESTTILRELVETAFVLDRTDDGTAFAEELVLLDPADWQLAYRLGRLRAGRGELAEAVELFEASVASPNLGAGTPERVAVQRDLGVAAAQIGKLDVAAEALWVVYDALQNPGKYRLTPRARTALRNDPQASLPTIAAVLRTAGRAADAVTVLQATLRDSRFPADAVRVELAGTQLAADAPADALATLDAYYAADPQLARTEAAELLGEVLGALGRGGEYRGRLESRVESAPSDTAAAFALARLQLGAGETDAAAARLAGVIAVEATPEAHLLLAEIRRDRGDAAGWLASVAAALNLAEGVDAADDEIDAAAGDDGFAAEVLDLPAPDAGTLSFGAPLTRGKLAAALARPDAARTGYDAAIEARPEDRFDLLADLTFRLAAAGEADAAEAVVSAALADDAVGDRRAEFLVFLAVTRSAGGKTDDALAALDEAARLRPGNPMIEYRRAAVLLTGDREAEAIAALEVVLASAQLPESLAREARLMLSALLTRTGEAERGEALLAEQFAATPDDPGVNNDLGYLWAERGERLEEAEAMIRTAVAAEPENPAFLDSLGWVLFRRGKTEEALPPLEKAVKLMGDAGDGTLSAHLGDVLDKLARPADARAAWETALEQATTGDATNEELAAELRGKLGE